MTTVAADEAGTLLPVDVREIVPEGLDRPEDIPAEIFDAAVAMLLAGERLDMGTLAERSGISRATLYRRIPDREYLLGQVVWFLVRHALVAVIEATQELGGADRIVRAAGDFFALITTPAPHFEQLLRKEPELSMRIFTTHDGPVHAGLRDAVAALVAQEIDAGRLDLGDLDPQVLALGIVRIGESFLWPRIFSGEQIHMDDALAIIRRLVR
jgi:AcrR family transcriptional regulator